MGKEITRRQFLRETLGTTATLSAGFFSAQYQS
nr:twin-arginine translocation signal domain-containing protein [Deltaproteobacteria bacterium]